MSKKARLEQVTLEILQDKKCHTVEEIKEYFSQKDPELLESSAFIYVCLNRMKKCGIVENVKRGVYRMNTEENKELKKENCKDMVGNLRREIFIEWENTYDIVAKEYPPSYDMTYEEFIKGKWLYQLNKQIENLIKNFQMDSNDNE